MTYTKLLTTSVCIGTLGTILVSASAEARDQRAAAQRSAPARVTGQAVQRVGPPRVIAARYGGRVPYRPYFYRPSFRVGIGFGYPYYYGYPYGYPYAYSGYGYRAYGYPYGYAVPPPGYLYAVPGRPYGGVRITDAPEDAEVFADGYYVGIVDDFDGVFQHMNLEAGAHRIEIRAQGRQPIAFDVRVEPGETITYHASLRQ